MSIDTDVSLIWRETNDYSVPNNLVAGCKETGRALTAKISSACTCFLTPTATRTVTSTSIVSKIGVTPVSLQQHFDYGILNANAVIESSNRSADRHQLSYCRVMHVHFYCDADLPHMRRAGRIVHLWHSDLFQLSSGTVKKRLASHRGQRFRRHHLRRLHCGQPRHNHYAIWWHSHM
jgi:hypothetical protein